MFLPGVSCLKFPHPKYTCTFIGSHAPAIAYLLQPRESGNTVFDTFLAFERVPLVKLLCFITASVGVGRIFGNLSLASLEPPLINLRKSAQLFSLGSVTRLLSPISLLGNWSQLFRIN